MKTVEQYLNALPEPYRSQAFANTKEYWETNYDRRLAQGAYNLWEALVGSFLWSRAPEGSKYWKDVTEGSFQPTLEARVAALEARLASPRVDIGIDPGPGWRLLGAYDTLQPDDEVARKGKDWERAGDNPAPYWWARRRLAVPTPEADEPEPEYRMLEVGETILEGDEATVDPGPGWRLVEIGETIVEGDEFLSGDEWKRRSFELGQKYNNHIHCPTRRRTKPEPKTIRERLETLPDGYRERALLLKGPSDWNKGAPSLAEAVFVAGSWERSKEGGAFWHAVYRWAHSPTENPLPPLPVPVYRLLNPGEVIREGDAGLSVVGGEDTWCPVSLSIGTKYNPDNRLPIRREIKTYEDA